MRPLWNLYTVLIFVTACSRHGSPWIWKLWPSFGLFCEGVSSCPIEGYFYDLKNKQCRLQSVWHFSTDHREQNRPACGTKRVNLGLPQHLLPFDLHSIILLGSFCSPILLTCPALLNLEILTVFKISGDLYIWYSSSLYLILQSPLSWTEPVIFLNIFLSKILKHYILTCDKVPISLSYINTGLMSVL